MRTHYPRLLRYAHWINVPLLGIMMWSGVLIYWAHQAYLPLPPILVKHLSLSYRLAEGMSWHFFIMWFYALNGLVYVSFFFVTRRWKMILPTRESLRSLIPYILYDLRIRSTPVEYAGIYNPAQRVAYTSAILLSFLAVASGLAIYKPVQLGFLTQIFGGYEGARLAHFICLFGLGIFIVIHLIQVARSGLREFRIMVTGEEL